MEGRKYWAQLILTSQVLARVFWIHTKERPGMVEKDMLAKLLVPMFRIRDFLSM